MIRIGGVGPRIAMAVLSSMNGRAFANCVADRDAARLARVPGIGKKTADRVILEMAGKMGDVVPLSGTDRGEAPPDVCSEVISALSNLGYKAADARRMMKKINVDADAKAEDVIREILRSSAR